MKYSKCNTFVLDSLDSGTPLGVKELIAEVGTLVSNKTRVSVR